MADQKTESFPFLISGTLVINGTPAPFRALGECEHYRSYGMPGTGQVITYWASSLRAVARVLPDNQAALLQLPWICLTPPGSREVELFQFPKDYEFVGFYFPNATHIEAFESYISVMRAPTAPIKVKARDLKVTRLDQPLDVSPPSALEADLVRRFDWQEPNRPDQNGRDFESPQVHVYPESLWSKKEILRQYFSKLTEVTLFPVHPADETLKKVLQAANLSFPITGWIAKGLNPQGEFFSPKVSAYYELPLVQKDGAWEIDRSAKGVRYYVDRGHWTEHHFDFSIRYKGKVFRWNEARAIYDPETHELIIVVGDSVKG